MRKKYTFLLTILPAEDEQDDIAGRLQLVQSNRAETFTNLAELRSLINRVLLSAPADIEPAATVTGKVSSSNGNGLGSST